jgi:uncharacterized coiled-coil protein SlyX
MKAWTHLTTIVVFLTCLISFANPGHTADRSREQIEEYGYIDWLNQKVYATGVGIAPQDKDNQTQAKTLAYRAAVVVAQRNLLEVIKGVHIDSHTRLEKRIVSDDSIISRIKGVVRFSQVENSQSIDDDTVRVTVSMPLGGKMGEVLIQAIEGSDQTFPLSASAPRKILDRLQFLEQRVTALENQLSRLSDISAEQKSLVQLFGYLVEAWQHNADHRAGLLQVGFASDEETAALRHQVDQQEKQMAAMYVHLNDLSRRLEVLEQEPNEKTVYPPQVDSPAKTYPYTGLIVDARDTGFKPSLRPGIFHQGQQLYPGSDLNLSNAVRSGYVRYYNDRHQAQQSDRIGKLPYATRATGTYGGNRGLSIDDKAFSILKTVLAEPQNFLSQCRVVIIF